MYSEFNMIFKKNYDKMLKICFFKNIYLIDTAKPLDNTVLNV